MTAEEMKYAAMLRNLRAWNEAYRNGTPLVSDAVYDGVEDKVKQVYKVLPYNNPVVMEITDFLKGVGAPPPANSHWQKAKHMQPMGSLNKVVNDGEAVTWYEGLVKRLEKDGLPTRAVWSDKLDGISIGLYYLGGHLVQAITRGDGEEGEDITRNVVKMEGVQNYVEGFTGDIRGEIVLRKTKWKAHFPEYANPRNAASGVAKRLDGAGSEHLTVMCYRYREYAGLDISAERQFKALKALGFLTPHWAVFHAFSQLDIIYNTYIKSSRARLDYDIDGLVAEFDDPTAREVLGDRNHRPEGARAYKFPAEQMVTTLNGILWSVGNTGRITPIAQFDSVNLVGANVSQASLHNLSNISKLVSPHGTTNFAIGDQIVVSRRNDVIPYVEELVVPNTVGIPISPPTRCPVCGAAVARDGEFLVCPNTLSCKAQVAGNIKVWVSKIGLKDVGDTLIDMLVETNVVLDPADLYILGRDELAEMTVGGRRVGGTADIVMNALHGKKELPLHIFVGSLNIPLCSRSTCKTIVDAGYDTLPKMFDASRAELAAISGIGQERASQFYAGIREREDVMEKLLYNGITIKKPATGKFMGVSVCLTGFRDVDMSDAIEAQGGSIKSSVGKDLSILVAKDPKSTSGKAAKAVQYGVEVIGIDEMWTRLGGRP